MRLNVYGGDKMSRLTISRDQDTVDQIDKILLVNEAANFPKLNF